MFESTENTIKNFREGSDGNIDVYKKEINEHIESIEKEKNIIGSGRTADVFFSKNNFSVCYKIIKNKEYYYNDVEKEAEFLSKLSEMNDQYVKTPEPLCSITSQNGMHVLIMEKMDAISIDDLLTGREIAIPENFEFRGFFRKIKDFIEKMHRKGIYHRDIHAGNIMIDKKTGNPIIIDFGSAKKNIISMEDPYMQLDAKGEAIIFVDDFNGVDQVVNQFSKYILKRRE